MVVANNKLMTKKNTHQMLAISITMWMRRCNVAQALARWWHPVASTAIVDKLGAKNKTLTKNYF